MAIKPLRLPRIQQGRPITDGQGNPAPDFVRRLNDTFQAIEGAYNALLQLPALQDAIQQAQAAADAANLAAQNAQDAADSAQGAADSNAFEQALVNSYITPSSVLTANPTTITIAAHTRVYADGTSKPVNGGTVAATASGDVDYVSYLDPTHAGGTVTYIASTTQPTQVGSTHVVGAITIPASGTASGGKGPARPGQVEP